MSPRQQLVLASGSVSRQNLFANAGLSFEIIRPDVDEAAIRGVFLESGEVSPEDVAEVLARAKAETVSASAPDRVVVGADQVLVFEGEIFEKPADMEAARRTLLRLKGRTHALYSAVCVAEGGETRWCHGEAAYLTMHNFDPAWLGRYLARAGQGVLTSVGAYQLEGLGVHLFDRIEGDYFTILGLPMLALLGYLRDEKGMTL